MARNTAGHYHFKTLPLLIPKRVKKSVELYVGVKPILKNHPSMSVSWYRHPIVELRKKPSVLDPWSTSRYPPIPNSISYKNAVSFLVSGLSKQR